MGKALDLTGQIYGRLTVLERAENQGREVTWKCKCECGKEVLVQRRYLRSGATKSCGCLQKEMAKEAVKKIRKRLDLTNQKYGHLTVIKDTGERQNGQVIWECECDCENHTRVKVTTNNLRSGNTKSCGCIHGGGNNPLELTGKKFGRLTALYNTGAKKGNTFIWHCKCDCGNECDVIGSCLVSGNTQSCGCLRKEINSKNNRIDLTGQTFGELTVLKDSEERKNESIIWICQCSCGNIIKVPTFSLTYKKIQSCGCIKSKGERKINIILNQNKIPYETQKTFENCFNPKTKYLFKFDFYVDNKYIIEYDGQQHFQSSSGWNTEEKVKYTQENDKIKNQFCLEHNIPLYRIPYIDYEKINNLKDILQDKYLVKNIDHYNLKKEL